MLQSITHALSSTPTILLVALLIVGLPIAIVIAVLGVPAAIWILFCSNPTPHKRLLKLISTFQGKGA